MTAIIVMNCEYALALFFRGPGIETMADNLSKDINRGTQNWLMNLKKREGPG